MFPLNLYDAVVADHVRRVRQLDCFGWMREGLSRKVGRRFGRRGRDAAQHDDVSSI